MRIKKFKLWGLIPVVLWGLAPLHAENDIDDLLDSIISEGSAHEPTPKAAPKARPHDETQGLTAAQIRELGVDYAEARNGKYKNEQRAIQLYIQAANKGDAKAQRWMGWRYRQGRGVQKDEQKAIAYFRRAANQGDQAAADAIGMDSQNTTSSGYQHAEAGGLTRAQARSWAENTWANYANNDLSYMYSTYESRVWLPAFGKHISQAELIKSNRAYTSRWAYRTCTPIDFAWNGNHIEIRFSFTCTNNRGKTVSGYCKQSIYISANNRIESFEDKTSSSHLPPFSNDVKR